MPARYTNPLSVTSQFFFCGLPLRLDSYRGCAYQCNFCYARYRGGSSPAETVVPADPGTLGRRLRDAFRRPPNELSFLGQFLRRRCPVHFGGMSDPFQPAERIHRVSLQFLRDLAARRYPTIISTRSHLVAECDYLEALRENGNVVVQFSFVTTDDLVSARFEPFSSTPRQLLGAMERLRREGIHVTCRWQPYIPTVSEPPGSFVARVTDAGAQHVALEHLKIPFERNHRLWRQFTAGAKRDLLGHFRDLGARADGREYVLPAEAKLPVVLETREAVRRRGATFGAADNEFQYLSDTPCCCSGADQFEGFGGWFKHQIAHAVRKCRGGRIVYGAIAREWLPRGSADRWLNSRSRLGSRIGQEGTIANHIKYRWNSPSLALSPASFHGVDPTDEFTPAGYRVYRWSSSVRRLPRSGSQDFVHLQE